MLGSTEFSLYFPDHINLGLVMCQIKWAYTKHIGSVPSAGLISYSRQEKCICFPCLFEEINLTMTRGWAASCQ